ncbi:MAG: hypothetical protein AAFX50_05410 [Acidobacteriota bacterium]
MSFYSCFKYILGLPTATLQSVVRGALAESETTGVPLGFSAPGVPIADGLTADVEAMVTDLDSVVIGVPGTGLDLTMGLSMRLDVEVVEMPALDPIQYELALTLPGEFGREEPSGSDPPQLIIHFPSVSPGDLGLVIDGGEILLTGDLLQPLIDDAVAANPDVLGVKVETGVEVPSRGEANVFSEIFHDDPTAPDFRGRITGSMSDPAVLQLVIPGRLRVIQINQPPLIDSEMTITVDVPVERDEAAGEIRVRFDQVTTGDVAVTFDPALSAIERPFAESRVKAEVATLLSAFDTATESIPTAGDLETLIGEEIAAFAQTQVIGFDMPAPADPEGVDISTFQPATHPGALLLQMEPLDDGTPCDGVDDFVTADGFSLVVARPALEPFLNQVRDEINGSSREIQGHTVRVTSITVDLRDPDSGGGPRGHMWVEGNADVEIDCWPDAGVDFWGPVFLSPRHELDGLHFDATTGEFGATDDTSCEDVDPDDVAALIESERFGPFSGLPTEFGGLGTVDLQVTSVEIFADGMRLDGTFALTTLSMMSIGSSRRRTFWAHEGAAGA